MTNIRNHFPKFLGSIFILMLTCYLPIAAAQTSEEEKNANGEVGSTELHSRTHGQGLTALCPEDTSTMWNDCVGYLVRKNGGHYIGWWQSNQPDGLGIYVFPNGDRYIGYLKGFYRSGLGAFSPASGQKLVAGRWRGDQLVDEYVSVHQASPEIRLLIDEFITRSPEKLLLSSFAAENPSVIARIKTKEFLSALKKPLEVNTERVSQDATDNPQISQIRDQPRLALLIGNANYKSSPLANPVNDVRGMATALRKAGFTVIKHENLNFKQMRNAVRDFGEKLSKDHVGFFYYSGHGVQVDGKNYLIPVNSDIKYEDEVATSALDADMVLAKLESAKNKLNIVVLDACRDSPLGRRTRTSTKGLSNMNAASGTMIAFSTAPGQVALDGKGSNSPYTKHLISAIQKEGLLLEQVFKEVRGNVMKDTNGTQVPWENSSILGDFYFVPKKD